MDRQKVRIIIFGVGQLLNEYIREMDIDEIVAFIDNDFNKLYQTIFGRIVVQPDRIREFAFDYVVIFNQKHGKEMRDQLIQLGVEEGQIISWQYYLYSMKRNLSALSRSAFATIYGLIKKLPVGNALDVENGIERNGLYIAGTDMRECFSYIDNYHLSECMDLNIYRKNIDTFDNAEFYDIIFFLDYYVNHTVEELQELIKRTYYLSKYILITLPYPCPDAWTKWNEIDFAQYGEVIRQQGRLVKLILIKKNASRDFAKNITIYTVAHKEFEEPKDKLFVPVFVGNGEISRKNVLRDSRGDNIADLNPKINELTALYWIWKNTRTDVVGVCHYRRYFAINPEAANMDFDLMDQGRIETELNVYEMIVSNAVCSYPFSLEEQLKKTVNVAAFDKGMELVRGRIVDVCPEYLSEFDRCLQGFIMYPCNMFITTWDIFSNYCQWLFEIIIDVSGKMDVSMYDSYSQRVIGFIAERLLTVWIKHNNIRVKEYPVIMIK